MAYATDQKPSTTVNQRLFLSQLCLTTVTFYIIIVFPIGNVAYALTWKNSNFQSYMMYLSKVFLFVPCGIYVLLNFKETIRQNRHKLYPLVLIILASAFAGIYYGNARNEPFYFLADIAGLLYSLLLVILIFHDAVQNDDRVEYWINVIIIGMVTTSVSVIFNYYALDGAKLWAPPQMELGATFALSAFLVRQRAGAFFYLAIALLTAAAYLSQLRASMAALLGVFLIVTVYSALIKGISKTLCVRFVSICAIATAVVMMTNTSILESRLSSTTIVFDEPQSARFADASANQRLVESRIILSELGESIFNWVFGRGAGATFANDGTFSHYAERVHNVHATPVALLFRAGLLGLAPYFLVSLWAGLMVLTKDIRQFELALAAAVVLASLLVNQFFYWGTFMAIGVGLLAAHRTLAKKKRLVQSYPDYDNIPKERRPIRNA